VGEFALLLVSFILLAIAVLNWAEKEDYKYRLMFTDAELEDCKNELALYKDMLLKFSEKHTGE